MDTLTIHLIDGQEMELPLVVAFTADGEPADLVGDVAPEHCDHKGATWSDCFDLRCPRCGSRLFLPASKLAHRPEAEIEKMHVLWVGAGWPSWSSGGWRVPDGWTLHSHPFFVTVGGLPVRNDRYEVFANEERRIAFEIKTD
jgi:hypothetical protein